MNIWNISARLSDAAGDVKDAVDTVLENAGAEAGDLSALIENFDAMRFVDNLSYMGVGMLGIFIVMGTLIIGTAILNKVTSPKKKD